MFSAKELRQPKTLGLLELGFCALFFCVWAATELSPACQREAREHRLQEEKERHENEARRTWATGYLLPVLQQCRT